MDIFTNPQILAVIPALVPVTVGLTQVLKYALLPDRFAPLASITIGIVIASLVFTVPAQVVVVGIMVGLTASGLYSGTRAMVLG